MKLATRASYYFDLKYIDFIVHTFYNAITGKFLLEALIFASTNPQDDERLFIKLQAQYLHENSKLKPPHVLQKEELLTKIFL